ncbi:MAG: 30S ribosome-binding factor RbfA [bacterium]
MAGHKIERISTEILRYVNQIILTEIEDEEIKKITITDCKVTSDLSYANVFFTYLGDKTVEEITEMVNDAAGFMRSKLCHMIDLRHTPAIRFRYDDTIEHGNKIEKIIHNMNK